MNSSVTSLKKNPVTDLFKFSKQPSLNNPILLVIWEHSLGNLAKRIAHMLVEKLSGEVFCEIKPANFYHLRGVEIVDDVAFIPQNQFFCGQRDDLVIFIGYEPQLNHHLFLSALLDIAQHHLSVQKIYTLSSFASVLPYNAPRMIYVVYNEDEIKEELKDYKLVDMTYIGPPAISSYLLWEAKKRRIPGISLWPEVPFYLAAIDDFRAQKVVLEFLGRRFNIQLDLGKIEKLAEEQSKNLLDLRMNDKEVDRYLGSIELNIPLSQEESLYLTNKIRERLQ